MANKQTTAVEWLAQQIQSDKIFSFDVVLKQALEMEREQIINAHGTKITRSTKQGTEFYETKSAEQYYTETYGKESNHSEQALAMERPRWVQFSERKPTESKYYFVKGKGGYGAHLPYLDEIGEFEIYNLPVNKFEAEYLQWLEE